MVERELVVHGVCPLGCVVAVCLFLNFCRMIDMCFPQGCLNSISDDWPSASAGSWHQASTTLSVVIPSEMTFLSVPPPPSPVFDFRLTFDVFPRRCSELDLGAI